MGWQGLSLVLTIYKSTDNDMDSGDWPMLEFSLYNHRTLVLFFGDFTRHFANHFQLLVRDSNIYRQLLITNNVNTSMY